MSEVSEESYPQIGYKAIKLGPREILIPGEWDSLPFDEAIVLNPKYSKPHNGPFDYLPMDAIDESTQAIEYWDQREKDDCTTTWFKNGDTVYAKITPCAENGKIAFIQNLHTEIGSGSTEFLVFHPQNGLTDERFVYYFSNLPEFRSVTISLMQGSTGRQRIPSDVFGGGIQVPLPPLPEQRRIAEILSTVDELIQQTDAVIEEKERLKRGLIQDLLTKGIGHESFISVNSGPVGLKIPISWSVEKIGSPNVSKKIKAGGTPKATKKDYYGGNTNFVKIEDMSKAGKYIKTTKNYLTKEGLDSASTWLVPENSLLLSMYGSYGKVAITHAEMATNQAILGIIPSDTVNLDYLYYASSRLKPYFESVVLETTQANLNKSIVKNTTILLPPLPEQRRIAEILSTVDDTIQKEQQTKTKLEALKRGLMQDLLTGKVRVPVET
jgi:type I restriction enzyme S subunit